MIGKRLKHYEVEEALGKGGMGVVYRARDTRLQRPVALKVLRSELTGDPERRRRFLQEARSASALTHPAIAQVYDVDEADGVIFIAMELVQGKTVRQLLQSKELDLQGAVDVALQVSQGLGRAHEAGIVHRDIKTDNIMLTPDGHAKILDFGLAKLLHPEGPDDEHASSMETVAQATQAGTILGTIAYMSPEQARGLPVDQRSDVFSMGIVLYEMVTGELPFQGGSALDTMHAIAYEETRPVTVVRRNLPPDLHRIISRCLRKRPDDRYPDGRALAKDLDALKRDIESGVERMAPSGLQLRERLESLRTSMPFGFVGIAVLVLAAAGIGYLIVSKVEVGALVTFAFIALLSWRFIRNRRHRMVKRLVSRMRKVEEVRAIQVRDDQITIVVDEAKAKIYVQVNGLVDAVNRKQFIGEPVSAEIRDDLTGEALQQLLRQPGVAYVRPDVLEKS
ncbi:MAG: protein kinase [Acidobacteriota bacterium]|jgi:serine/threonine protein kinase